MTGSLVGLLGAVLAVAGETSVKVGVVLVDDRPGEPEVAMTVSAEPVASSGPQSPHRAVGRVNMGTGTASLRLAPGKWSFRAEADGHWGETVERWIGSDDYEVGPIRLWPTGVAVWDVTTEDERELRDLGVTFRGSPEVEEEARVPQGTVECAVSGAVARCELPATALDLRVGSRRYIPDYYWNVGIKAGSTSRRGRLRLELGASIVGFVRTRTGDVAPVGTRVELATTEGEAVRQEVWPGSAPRPYWAATNRQGFFQLRQVPPGEFQLTASSTAGDWAIAEVSPQHGLEFRLSNHLILDEALRLDVSVSPATDIDGQPLTLTMLRASPPPRTRQQFPIPGTGSLAAEPLVPGLYLVRVESSTGRRLYADEVTLGRNPAPLSIDLQAVKVSGTITLGTEPLEADLFFGTSRGHWRSTLRSNERGDFEGYVPREGRWAIEIVASDPPVNRILEKVDVSRGEDGSAHLELQLPGTSIAGVVIDEEGESLVPAIVTVQPAEERQQLNRLVQVHADGGRFEIRGLPTGEATIFADAGHLGRSELLEVYLGEGNPQQVTLVARRGVEALVRVQTPAGLPVPGATVKAVPLGAAPLPFFQAVTDASGAATLRLPQGTTDADVSVWAPGYSLVFFRTRIAEAEALVITAAQDGGDLVIRPPDGWDPESPEADAALVSHRGAVNRLRFLRDVSRVNRRSAYSERSDMSLGSGEVVVPLVEPGAYTVCLIDRLDMHHSGTGPNGGLRCASGIVGRGQRTVIELREAAIDGVP